MSTMDVQGRRTSARIQKQQTKHAIFADPNPEPAPHTFASTDAMDCERALSEDEPRAAKRARRGLRKPAAAAPASGDAIPDLLRASSVRAAPSPASHGKLPRGSNRRAPKVPHASATHAFAADAKPHAEAHVEPSLPVAASPALPSDFLLCKEQYDDDDEAGPADPLCPSAELPAGVPSSAGPFRSVRAPRTLRPLPGPEPATIAAMLPFSRHSSQCDEMSAMDSARAAAPSLLVDPLASARVPRAAQTVHNPLDPGPFAASASGQGLQYQSGYPGRDGELDIDLRMDIAHTLQATLATATSSAFTSTTASSSSSSSSLSTVPAPTAPLTGAQWPAQHPPAAPAALPPAEPWQRPAQQGPLPPPQQHRASVLALRAPTATAGPGPLSSLVPLAQRTPSWPPPAHSSSRTDKSAPHTRRPPRPEGPLTSLSSAGSPAMLNPPAALSASHAVSAQQAHSKAPGPSVCAGHSAASARLGTTAAILQPAASVASLASLGPSAARPPSPHRKLAPRATLTSTNSSLGTAAAAPVVPEALASTLPTPSTSNSLPRVPTAIPVSASLAPAVAVASTAATHSAHDSAPPSPSRRRLPSAAATGAQESGPRQYARSIYVALRLAEARHAVGELVAPTTPRNRAVLVDWVVDVHRGFGWHPQTLYVATSIIDRYVSRKRVPVSLLQLVGATGMLLACKHEETEYPQLADLVALCPGNFTPADVRLLELDMLAALDFKLTVPSALEFLTLYCGEGAPHSSVATQAEFLLELSLVVECFRRASPSVVAAAALELAAAMRGTVFWTAALLAHFSYSREDIVLCASFLNQAAMAPAMAASSIFRKHRARHGGLIMLPEAVFFPLPDMGPVPPIPALAPSV